MTLVENFQEFRGLDYRSNNANRKKYYATEVKNVEPLINTGFSTTKGFKGISNSAGGGGTKEYVRRERSGIRTIETIRIDSNLHREKTGSLTITYSGSGESVVAKLIPQPDAFSPSGYGFTFKLIVDDGLFQATMDLGAGIDLATPPTIQDLKDFIDGLADFACTSTGVLTGPAAFLPNFQEAVGAGITIEFKYSEQIYCPTTNPFASFASSFSDDDFELATLLNTNNLLFIATGFNKFYKYDGAATYAAGMPAATTFSGVVVGGGAIDSSVDDTRRYFITYEQIDAVGRSVEGNNSNIIELTFSVGNEAADLTIPTVQDGSEYNTAFARANNGGTETGTTITVDSGHNIKAGMAIFFVDPIGAGNDIFDFVVSVTNTTITMENSHTIANNAPISAGLIIHLWREKAGTDEFYRVDSFANDPTVTDFVFNDPNQDDFLLERYEVPIQGHGLPPENLKYLTVYKGLIVGANGSDTVYFSDPDGPEYWNRNFVVRTKSNELVRSVGSNKEILLVQKSNESTIVNGDLPGSNFTQEILADAIGTESHHSVIDVEDSLWFMSGTQGVRRIVRSNNIADVSYRILPALVEDPSPDERSIVHRRVVAINVKRLQLALFFCPCETQTAGTPLPNENSVVFVGDYRAQFDADVEYDEAGRVQTAVPRVRWWKWSGFNFAGGICLVKGQLQWTERRFNVEAASNEYPLCARLENDDEFDYCQHAEPFDFRYEGEWMGSATVFFKWLNCVVHSLPQIGAPAFTVNVSTELNYEDGMTDSQLDLVFSEGATAEGWGFDPWGEFAWGNPLKNFKLFPFLPTRAKSLKLVFSGSAYLEQCVISGWVTDVVPVYAPKVKEGSGTT